MPSIFSKVSLPKVFKTGIRLVTAKSRDITTLKKPLENIVGKGEMLETSIFSFFHKVSAVSLTES